MSRTVFLFAAILLYFEVTRAYERVFLTSLYDSTGSCSHQSSLEYGFTVQWDPDVSFNRGEFAFRPGWIFDCVITFNGRTDLDGMPTRHSVAFREDFIFAAAGLTTTGSDVPSCDKAHVKLYTSLQDYLDGNDPVWTHCSIGELPGTTNGAGGTDHVYEVPESQARLTLRFYVDFHIQEFNNATMNPNFTTTTLITTPNPKNYPRIGFYADFTAFVHNDTCVNLNDEMYLRCNHSRRCLARTDVCDFAFGWNCRDNDFYQDQSDRVIGYPAYCGHQYLTTSPGGPPVNPGIAVGVGLGVVVIGASVVIIIVCVRRRRRREHEQTQTQASRPTSLEQPEYEDVTMAPEVDQPSSKGGNSVDENSHANISESPSVSVSVHVDTAYYNVPGRATENGVPADDAAIYMSMSRGQAI